MIAAQALAEAIDLLLTLRGGEPEIEAWILADGEGALLADALLFSPHSQGDPATAC